MNGQPSTIATRRRLLPRRSASLLCAAAFALLTDPCAAQNRYTSPVVDLNQHRVARQSFAMDEAIQAEAVDGGLTPFAPADGANIQRIKQGRIERPEIRRTAAEGWIPSSMQTPREQRPSAGAEGRSFIDRENAGTGAEPEEVITRIGINLGFVLAIAIGCILLIKQWQKSGSMRRNQLGGDFETLRISQSLSLTSGASLQVVEGFGQKFLVAIDGAGIKSVEVLQPGFRETLERTEAYEDLEHDRSLLSARATNSREPNLREKRTRMLREQAEQESRRKQEPTPDIDEKLIKLLLSKSKQAG